MDDAGVYRLNEDIALIQTVDFFTPVVDDPWTYGAIAAANSLSDVYAMGGRPLTALAVTAVPDNFNMDILGDIFAGGQAKANEAGVPIVGGHTVKCPELKYGLAITGTVHPDRIVTNAGAAIGDNIYLTKPLGTGIITTALKEEKCPPEILEGAVASMLALNSGAAEAMIEAGAVACTDITGFGLVGHAHSMAHTSGVALELEIDSLPLLPGAAGFAAEGFIPGGLVTNRSHIEKWIRNEKGIEEGLDLLFDPQTSGGLLISIPDEKVPALETALACRGIEVNRIGRVVDGEEGELILI